MIAASPIVKPISHLRLEPGSVVTVPNVTWAEFEQILQELGQKRRSRIAYSNNTFQIMVPLPEHEKPTDLMSDIVKTLLKATKKRYEPFRSTTFTKAGSAGVEPDASFYIANYQRMIGRKRLDPSDPPPDLAIETDVTSKTTLDAYLAIAVPELWVYDDRNLTIYLLQDHQYVESETSPNFPGLPIRQLIPATVERSWQVGNLQALEELEAILKAQS